MIVPIYLREFLDQQTRAMATDCLRENADPQEFFDDRLIQADPTTQAILTKHQRFAWAKFNEWLKRNCH